MLNNSPEEPRAAPAKLGRGNRYIERTLLELTNRHAAALRLEEIAGRPGFLQRMNPQLKIVLSASLIIACAFIRSLPILFTLYILVLMTASLSKLPLAPITKRVWAFVVLFAGAIVLPAALNTVTPGRELLLLWEKPYLSITVPGVLIASTLMLKIAVAITLGMMLTLSTRWNSVLIGLAALRAPTLFLTILAMTHRYLTVLMQTAADMFTARQSRLVGRQSNSQGRSFVGAGAGTLFGKSHALSDEIHQAMISRGFRGQFKRLDIDYEAYHKLA